VCCCRPAHGSPPKGRHCGVVLRVLGHPYLPAPWASMPTPASCHGHVPAIKSTQRHQRHTSPSQKQNKMDILQRREYLSVQFRNHTHNASELALGPASGSTMFIFLKKYAQILSKCRMHCRSEFFFSWTNLSCRWAWMLLQLNSITNVRQCLDPSNFQKFYKISCHIESLDACMEY
jgi:hypothetical protein